ncbi:gp9 [Salmonella enterica subsp. enterica serovar Agona str. 632182-2]|nr:gp9 [Salmonella enterica subsp. enterica serovar Agona str. 632182-2]
MTNDKITDVKQFTKKPVTISAIQWTGENLPAVIEFTGKHPRWGGWFADMDEYVAHVRGDGNRFKIYTLEGVMDALPGDWIIRGVQGEHYPCKPDIFAATYEPAELQERRKADSEPASLPPVSARLNWYWMRRNWKCWSGTAPPGALVVRRMKWVNTLRC